MSTFLVMVPNYYGHGETLDKAKANLRKEHMGSRKLSDGYVIVEFPDGLTFTGVDMLGQVHWNEDADGGSTVQPIVTDVAKGGKKAVREKVS